jgi:plastocyanin
MKAAALVTVLAALAGCGGSASNGGMIGPCPATVNGCTTFTDLTADPTAVIEFGGVHGLAYAPACAQVKVGQTIEFQGDFGAHPLSETCGPIDAIPTTRSGTSKSFTIATAGTYGYQCDVHSGSGMIGALKVVP